MMFMRIKWLQNNWRICIMVHKRKKKVLRKLLNNLKPQVSLKKTPNLEDYKMTKIIIQSMRHGCLDLIQFQKKLFVTELTSHLMKVNLLSDDYLLLCSLDSAFSIKWKSTEKCFSNNRLKVTQCIRSICY